MSAITNPMNTQAIPQATTTIKDSSNTTNATISLNKKQLLSQTTRRRDEATKLLTTLLDAKKVSERNLASIHQDDLLKRVTGNSSMDNAIASTRKLIDSFNRVIDDLRRNLTDEDLALI
ncbi:MAG: hypothetical protein JKY43_07335 [Phycisphaerales bacterium]|nr:hypothetical protein [Phycisphaerales bacterium]